MEQETLTLNIILEQNIYNRELLKKVVSKEITPKQFKQFCNKRYSFWQWGNKSYNIRDPSVFCKHKCTYCYMNNINDRFKHETRLIDMEDLFPLDIKAVNKKWKRTEKSSVYFFPSSHDIFYENIQEYISTAKKIMDSGNDIMFVTKPHFETIKKISEGLKNYKDHIAYYMTITSDDNNLLRVFEPNAAPFEERLECLKYLYENGCRTSVMCEPYLSNPVTIVDKCLPYIKDAFIIGEMNYNDEIVDKLGNIEFSEQLKKYITELYSINFQIQQYNYYCGNPKIFFKKGFYDTILKLYK